MGLIAMCVGGIFNSIICLVINTHYTGKLIRVGFSCPNKRFISDILVESFYGDGRVFGSKYNGFTLFVIINIWSGNWSGILCVFVTLVPV